MLVFEHIDCKQAFPGRGGYHESGAVASVGGTVWSCEE